MNNKNISGNESPQNSERLGYKFTADLSTGFHYEELPTNAYETSRVLEQNSIIFMMSGSCSFSYDHYINRVFFAGDMIFFPKAAMVTGLVLEDVKFLYMSFDMPLNSCDKQYIQQQWEETKDISFDFTPLKMTYAIGVFVNSVVYLLKNGGDCPEIHEAKHKEIFILLRLFYSKKEYASFFYPIIGESFNFKNFVLENYINCYNLKELIERSNMCPNIFMRKFKKEFGMSGYQWILKQMCLKIQHKASIPGVTIKEIMREVGIESPSHFNRVCKRYFNQTPKHLIIQCQSDLATK